MIFVLIDEGNYKLYKGDCLEVMNELIKQGIKVDMILTDLPYGITKCKWDSVIPLEPMWKKVNELIKPNGAICLFGSEPFSSALRMSNIKKYRYDLKWQKDQGTDFMLAKKKPLKDYEDIMLFYKKQPTYNPQMREGFKPWTKKDTGNNILKHLDKRLVQQQKESVGNKRYPISIIKFNREKTGFHPTQKPVALLEYLIKTYTNEGELVLDFTMGSGSTGVACLNTNRKFIGIELDEKYFNIAIKRLKDIEKYF